MKHNRTIYAKAAFLMLVFSLNTLLGFACSLGIDMGYNKHHHQSVKAETSLQPSCHGTGDAKNNHTENNSQNTNNDDCCSNGVTSFSLMAKSVTPEFSIVHPVLALIVGPSFFQLDIFSLTSRVDNILSFAQSHHPPIHDIRIAIQSFQV